MTDPGEVVAALADIRQRGYATVVDENILGVTSVGAPIRTSSGRTRAALSVAFARQFSPELTTEAAAAIVVDTAQKLSKDLGYSQAGAG